MNRAEERARIARLISHLLSHDSYGYQNTERVVDDLKGIGWSPQEAIKAIQFWGTKECFRHSGWELNFEVSVPTEPQESSGRKILV
jgi:hypothetical protein